MLVLSHALQGQTIRMYCLITHCLKARTFLTLQSDINQCFNDPEEVGFKNIMEKGENTGHKYLS